MTLSAHRNARYTETGRARRRQVRDTEDGAWAIADLRTVPDPALGMAGVWASPLSTRMLCLYEISYRRVEAHAPAPSPGARLAAVVLAEEVGRIAAMGMYPPDRHGRYGTRALMESAMNGLRAARFRSDRRRTLAEQAVSQVWKLLTIDELVDVLCAPATHELTEEYQAAFERVRELAMFEVTLRTPPAPPEAGDSGQLWLEGI
jgi:hypothetical protein